MEQAAAQALAEYKWDIDWSKKYGRYYPMGGAKLLGQFKDTSSRAIHSLMCHAMGVYNRRKAG